MSAAFKSLLSRNGVFAKDYAYSHLRASQAPHTLWIGCVDSRVAPELVTQSEVGELLVHRNIGNLMKDDEHSNGLIHFAVSILKIRNVVVCGHSNCGACLRSIAGGEHAIDKWLTSSRHRYHSMAADAGESGNEDKAESLSKENTLAAVDWIAQHKDVKSVWDANEELVVSAMYLDVESGKVEVLKTISKM